MEPGLNRTFVVGVRRSVWMRHELAAALGVMGALIAFLRPLLRWLVGRPVITPLVCCLLAALAGGLTLAFFLSWRLREHDRSDYLLLMWRRLVVRRGAYNALHADTLEEGP